MVRVLVLTSEGCKPCTRVKRILTELQTELTSLRIETLDMTSPEGTKLAIENQVLYPPAVFIEGKLLGKGKIDANEMVKSVRAMNGDFH
jgi:glutaredoxin